MRLIWASCLFVTCLFSKDLGIQGQTFPIEEKNLIDFMKCKTALHEEDLKRHTEEIEKYIQNPSPIEGIGKATEKRSSYYDPTFTVEEEVALDDKIVAKAGDRINFLETTDLPGGMLFFDGTDPAQVAWAKKEPSDFKWVLIKGSPIALEEQEERSVYFDQFGMLTSQFKIKNVPAKVAQSGAYLLIEEIPIDEAP